MLIKKKRKIIIFSYESSMAVKGKIINDKIDAKEEYFFIPAIISHEKIKISPSK